MPSLAAALVQAVHVYSALASTRRLSYGLAAALGISLKETSMGTAINCNIAFMTGAASGVGLELLKQCVQRGFDVTLHEDEPQRDT